MNLYQLDNFIRDLEQLKNPYPYDTKLLNFYKDIRKELIEEIKNKLD